MNKELIIELPVTPSNNKLVGKRWAKLNYQKKFMKCLSGYELLALKKKKKAKIKVIRYGSRLLDEDNFIGGLKPLLDTIVKLGLIVDDRPEWLELNYKQEKCKRGEEKTVIILSYI